MSCDDARPCKRCVDRGIPELCSDHVIDKKRGRKATYLQVSVSDEHNIVSQTLPLANSPSVLPPLQTPPPVFAPPEFVLPFMHFKPDPGSISSPSSDISTPLDFQFLLADMLVTKTPVHFEEPQDEVRFWKLMDLMRQQLMKGGTAEEADAVIASVVGLRRHIQTTLVSQFNGAIPASIPRYWQMDIYKNEIAMFVDEQKRLFDGHGTPTIIWDRSGSIHFVNEAYKRLTSWNLPLPTSREDFHFHNELSPSGFKEFVVNSIASVAQFPKRTESNWFMFNTGVRIHTVANKFIEGTMSITFKQDMLGFPLINVGNFLPRTVTSTPPPRW